MIPYSPRLAMAFRLVLESEKEGGKLPWSAVSISLGFAICAACSGFTGSVKKAVFDKLAKNKLSVRDMLSPACHPKLARRKSRRSTLRSWTACSLRREILSRSSITT